jgi:hypothetical protein
MAAHVVERTESAGRIANEHDALAAHIDDAMISWSRQLFLAPDAQPLPEEDLFLLESKHVLALIPEGGQRWLEAREVGRQLRGHGVQNK